MSSPLTVEQDPVIDDDLSAALVDVWVAVSNAGGAVGFVPPTDAATVHPVAQDAFDRVRRGRDRVAVARLGTTPVGFGFLRRREVAIFDHVGVIRSLQVHPDHQGSGIGGAILEALAAAAPADGVELLHLTVRGGTGRERFYQRHGFEVVATVPGLIRVAPGDDRDELHLLRRL